jgi:hypothetical protein
MSRSLASRRLRWQAAGRPGGKGQSPVVPRGFEKRQEVDPVWPPVQVPLRGDPAAVVIRPGYLDGHWTKASWTDQGVHDKVGTDCRRRGVDKSHAMV